MTAEPQTSDDGVERIVLPVVSDSGRTAPL